MILPGRPKNSEKPCPSATLFTTNPTLTDLGTNPGLCGERPVTNCLNHGTASYACKSLCELSQVAKLLVA
jgi:hypothetical protein